MLIYVAIFLFLLIPVIRFDLMKIEGNKSLWFYSSLIILILLAGLRYRVGSDTLIYMRQFNSNPSMRELSTFNFRTAEYNPLWYIFNSPFVTMKSFTMFQIAHATVVNSIFFWFFRKYVPTAYFTAIFVYYFGYFFYFNMDVLRESLCVGILLLAYPYLEKKKFIQYYLLCIVALFMHMSAIVMFVIPFTLIFKRDNIYIFVCVFCSLICLLLIFDIVSFILSIAFEGIIAEKINSYLHRDAPNLFGIALQFLTMLPVLLVTFVRNRNHYNNDKTIGAILLMLIAIQTVGMSIAAFVRFNNYMAPFCIVFIINTFYLHYWDMRRHFKPLMIVYCALFVYAFSLSRFYFKSRSEDYPGGRHYHTYIPYHSIFDPVEDERRETLIKNMRSNDMLIKF